ncbi:hypothetical protein AAG570_009742 [Ranatra chinensis]|uniref:Uncharacterized protein n=1 Tax=Ranatra chinensis TaxID=642074 RepID=A0ABD0YQ37_9HEMI
MIGWTGRLQFEETWVCLLSALSPNPDLDSSDQEEISAIMQVKYPLVLDIPNSIAVDGITWLVLSTLALNVSSTNTSDLFHVPRQDNSSLYKLSYWKKLEAMNESLCWRLKKISSDERIELIRIDKRPNIERGNNNSGFRYSLGQLSVAYLQAQVTPFEERESSMNAKCAEREKCLSDSGIDIRSCTQFLLDLFSQWTLPNSGISLNLQLSMVRSVLSLSDMFTEQAHFTWMLNTFIDLSKNHPQHDEVLHQYLVIGVCKATAVLKNFEGESAEKVTKVLENSLKNQFPPMRLAGIHGLLYLLQSVRTIKKSWVNVDSTQKFGIQDFRQKVLQITLDYILKYCTGDTDETSENVLLEVALVMYLLEYFYYEVPNTQAIMKFITQLVKRPVNNKCYQATMQGLEKLILSGGNDLSEQITRLALDRFSQSDPCITLPALQLLISCIYSGIFLCKFLCSTLN